MVSYSFARPYLAGLLAALLWAGNFVVGKSARMDLPPFTLALCRWLIAFVVLTPFVWPGLVNKLAPFRRSKGTILVLALSGITLTNTLVYIGLGSTSAGSAVLINAGTPACVFVLAYWLSGARATMPALLGMLLSACGVVFMVTGASRSAGAPVLSGGDAWVMLAVVCWAVYTVWQQRLPAGTDRLALLWLLMGVGLLPLLPFAVLEWATMPVHPGARALWSVAYLALGPSLVAMLAYDRAIRSLGPGRAGLFLNLIPVFGLLLSSLMLGERPGFGQGVALAVILAGLVVANLPPAALFWRASGRAGA
ncbi:DMT family transporter [Paludibacterium paludis]|uniref:Multidrug DMT transporter permease n=1 Tax=Paludibacterium paludis TaxID=1225769 RepID=A0A918P6D4_9NEIS|nr:DMT family transporter [Paludibacterium paludis]GGY25709.1 multidrug DMT transporter permease [Paludibacterium paludis]